MARVKIKFPNKKPLFTCNLNVRIGDINYGNHLGNDAVLSLAHESRLQTFGQWGYTEMDCGGTSLIMADAEIAFKGEAFYGEALTIDVWAEVTGERSFDLLYQITKLKEEQRVGVAHLRTGMVTFDYTTRKIVPMTEDLRNRLEGIVF